MAFFEIQNFKKNFGTTEVLNDISFRMEKGEVLAIIGASGSGKTTLLRCINFLEKADCGRMFIDGKLLLDAQTTYSESEEQLRQKRLHFGLVFQSFNLFPQYTALQNVMLAPRLIYKSSENEKEIEEQAKRLLARVGLSDKMSNYPHELSGGQQQRVAIARALILNPDVLCFDEPTSALDPELTGEVLKVIKSLKSKDRTMIVVTHEMEFARNIADKVLFMANGMIEEYGTADEVFLFPRSEKTKAFLSKLGDVKGNEE
ncbi:MAG: amino acid ABC transporter ATP-binding protein [Clostridiales bacterium]|nr:amino acid ABC transporter ATP-binding protein [Clostridiales bacterium]